MLAIGDCAVHPETHVIRRDGRDIRVPHKVMAALACLIAHEGRVVTKSRLIAEVWDGAYTSDEVITTTIYELRKALGDDARSPRYVETIRKSGYRLVASVRERSPHARTRGPAAKRRGAPGAEAARRRGPRRSLFVGVSLGAVALSAIGIGQMTERPAGAGDAAAVQPIPAAACEAYLEGHQFLNLGTKSGLQKAVDAFRQATEIDPTLGMAYAALAECFTTGDWGLLGLDWPRAHARARDAAERALEIDASDPVAHAALASIRFFHEWDWRRAEAAFASCADMTSCAPRAGGRQYAAFLSAMGRHDEAIALLEDVVAQDPLSLRSKVLLVRGYYFARRLDDARDRAESLLELHANEPVVHELLGDVHLAAGRPADAFEAYRRSLALADIATRRGGGLDDHLHGARVQERRIADERRRLEAGASPVRLARLLAQTGRRAEAVALLTRALDERRSDVVWINTDPGFDPIRSHPGFRGLLARLRLSA